MRLPEGSEIGPEPRLVQPVKSRQPTVKIFPALPWPEGSTPLAAASTQVAPLATAPHHPRWLNVRAKPGAAPSAWPWTAAKRFLVADDVGNVVWRVTPR